MITRIKRLFLCALTLVFLAGLIRPAYVRAEENDEAEMAETISGMQIVTAYEGIQDPFRLFDRSFIQAGLPVRMPR